MNDLVSEYQQYQDASVDEEEFDEEEEEAEDAEWIVLIADFKMPRRRRQRRRERQKSNRLRLAKQQQLCTCVTLFFFGHFFTVTARLGREKALNIVDRNWAPEEFACI